MEAIVGSPQETVEAAARMNAHQGMAATTAFAGAHLGGGEERGEVPIRPQPHGDMDAARMGGHLGRAGVVLQGGELKT